MVDGTVHVAVSQLTEMKIINDCENVTSTAPLERLCQLNIRRWDRHRSEISLYWLL